METSSAADELMVRLSEYVLSTPRRFPDPQTALNTISRAVDAWRAAGSDFTNLSAHFERNGHERFIFPPVQRLYEKLSKAASLRPTVGERLYWAYACQAMAEKALYDLQEVYGREHYMIRARLFRQLCQGAASPGSFLKDHRIRLKLPRECVYCGDTSILALDHVVAKDRGGEDSGDNVVWACRRCNSSKGNRDLFQWWFGSRAGFPPLFAVRVYLKQAIVYCTEQQIAEHLWAQAHGHPYSFESIPVEFPQPKDLIFSPYHVRLSETRKQMLRSDESNKLSE